jgi:VWFA-related protein
MRAPLIRLFVTLFVAAALLQVSRAEQQPPAGAGSQQQPPPPPPAGQTPQDPQRQPTFRSGINFVRVDVIVSDKDGNPILDLKPEDFSVSEDGHAQKVEQFQVIRIDPLDQVEGPTNSEPRSAIDEEREASRPEVRLFVILLDDYHVRRGNDMSVRKPLIDFIENQLAPADMVAIMYPLTPVDDISFTRNKSRLISAIQNFEGRKFNYTPRNLFEEQYTFYPAAVVERIRNQVTMSALKAAAYRLGALREGRKSIIFVSEGMTELLPAQLNDPVAEMPGLRNPNRNNPNARIDERTEWQAKLDMANELQEVFQTVNTQNTSIYAVDPRGLAVFEYGINESVGLQKDMADLRTALDSLRVLADNTDGRAIINRNDLATGMKQIIRDASGYYLLGYTSNRSPSDGKFHEIKVSVARRGVQVRARKGYWALTKDDIERATAPAKPEAPAAVTKALTALATPPGGRAADFWVGTSLGQNGRTKVTFAWEPGLGEAARTQDVPTAATVMLTAVAPDGRPVFRGRVPDPPSTSQSDGGVVSFEAPPGQLQLRMTVEAEGGRVLDSSTRELTLPDYTQTQVSLGTPRLYRARTARDVQIIRANAAAAPAVEREFSRTERLLIQIDAYAPGGSVPAVTAKLLNRAGTKMSDFTIQRAASGGFETELPLSALAAGEYLIEFTAKTESGTAQDTIAFRDGKGSNGFQ